ncbi:hypothetical protein [Nakamurella deserti]|uniref:hypothetical protein n=1 Tax=Nakamurella deserti TaxID=2164074 RepID=UPI001300B822|nr:hypothetical protein [Nakamurella deserti]
MSAVSRIGCVSCVSWGRLAGRRLIGDEEKQHLFGRRPFVLQLKWSASVGRCVPTGGWGWGRALRVCVGVVSRMGCVSCVSWGRLAGRRLIGDEEKQHVFGRRPVVLRLEWSASVGRCVPTGGVGVG